MSEFAPIGRPMTVTSVTSTSTARPGTRAVLRRIDPGADATCPHCEGRVKFVARAHGQQVIANVYVRARWDRVEHFHAACYTEAGEPHGPAAD